MFVNLISLLFGGSANALIINELRANIGRKLGRYREKIGKVSGENWEDIGRKLGRYREKIGKVNGTSGENWEGESGEEKIFLPMLGFLGNFAFGLIFFCNILG